MGETEEIFTCTMCGKCCQGFGGTLVSEEDIRALAAFVDVAPEAFRRDFCAVSGLGVVLAQKPDGYCVFYTDRCSVHPVKPAMCRKWPFIEAVVRHPENWAVMASACPGMKADSPVEKVRQVVAAELSSSRP
ncbi:MAG: YkgJ family cysteine cluster protein [Thermodesulfobacteriota bacterium]